MQINADRVCKDKKKKLTKELKIIYINQVLRRWKCVS
jgi:hypothetical protein